MRFVQGDFVEAGRDEAQTNRIETGIALQMAAYRQPQRRDNMKSVAVLLAPGFEEIEAITVIDVLRRAEVRVTVAGLQEGEITGSHEITVRPDKTLDEVRPEEFDMVVLPGGLPGTDHLRDDPRVTSFVREMERAGKYTCAICAAPTPTAVFCCLFTAD